MTLKILKGRDLHDHRPIGFNTKMVLLGLDDFGPSQCEQLPIFDAGLGSDRVSMAGRLLRDSVSSQHAAHSLAPKGSGPNNQCFEVAGIVSPFGDGSNLLFHITGGDEHS